MKRYELSMIIDDSKYVDRLIIALARQGYAPYISYDKDCVCIEVSEEELSELKK